MKEKDKKYQALFDVALELFSIYGYKKTTVDDVAQRLSMSKGNLYFYVKNKRDLYEKTINHALVRWKAHVAMEMEREEDLVQRFRTMALSSISYVETNPQLRKILINDPSIFTLAADEDRFRDTNLDAMKIMKGLLEEGIRKKVFYPVDVDHITEYLFSVYIMFLIKRYIKSDGSSSETMFREGLELTLRGLRYPGENDPGKGGDKH